MGQGVDPIDRLEEERDWDKEGLRASGLGY